MPRYDKILQIDYVAEDQELADKQYRECTFRFFADLRNQSSMTSVGMNGRNGKSGERI
jgi:hypothetical protein